MDWMLYSGLAADTSRALSVIGFPTLAATCVFLFECWEMN